MANCENPECKKHELPQRGISKSIGRDSRCMRESAKSWLRLNYEDPGRKVRSLENDERTTFRVSAEPSRLLGDAEWQCGKPLKWKATSHFCRVTLYTRICKISQLNQRCLFFAESSRKKDAFLGIYYDFTIYDFNCSVCR